ncbi:hypothetical protein O3M35_009961 [Rhynocoris fuscipes]|uniref:Uncharacterized protein n=1 Tax=Rhynocoris fuscipes TaxID=488301 RepID=A0AAW1CYM2_9HEMI
MSGEEVPRTINIHDLVLIKVLLPEKVVATINDKNGEYLENFCKMNNVEITIVNVEIKSDNDNGDNSKILKIIGEYSKVLITINMISVFSTLDISIDSEIVQQLTVLIDNEFENLLIKNNEETLNLIRIYSGAEIAIINNENYGKCLIIKGEFTANSKACKLILKLLNNDENINYIKQSMIDLKFNINNENNKHITISEMLKRTGFKDSD